MGRPRKIQPTAIEQAIEDVIKTQPVIDLQTSITQKLDTGSDVGKTTVMRSSYPASAKPYVCVTRRIQVIATWEAIGVDDSRLLLARGNCLDEDQGDCSSLVFPVPRGVTEGQTVKLLVTLDTPHKESIQA